MPNSTTLLVAVESAEALAVVEILSARLISSVASPGRESVAFATDGTHMVHAASGEPVRILDITTKIEEEFEPQVLARGTLALGPQGQMLAARQSAGAIRVCERGSKGQSTLLAGNESTDIFAVAFDADARNLLQGGKGNFIRILSVADGREVALRRSPLRVAGAQRPPRYEDSVGWVSSLAVSPNGTEVLCGGPYATLVIRDRESLQGLIAMEGHTGSISALAASPDGLRVLSIGGEGTLAIADRVSGRRLLSITFFGSKDWVAVAADGRVHATPGARDQIHQVTRRKDGGFATQPVPAVLLDPKLIERALGQ